MYRERDLLDKYGAYPKPECRDEIRALLMEEIEGGKHEGSHEYLRVLCYLLFILGNTEDCELIWKAKTLNMDTGCMIDSIFLCGAGYEQTVSYAEANGLDKLKKWLLLHADRDFDKEEIADEFMGYYGLLG